MEKYSAVSCPGCKGFKVEKTSACTTLVDKGELVKEATANTGEVFRCLECQREFTMPAGSSGSEEKTE